MARCVRWLCLAPVVLCATAGIAAADHILPLAVEPRSCANFTPCDPNEIYRRLDGSCNNLQFPTWGMTLAPYTRLLQANYSDDKYMPRKANDGSELPPARRIRVKVLWDKELPDRYRTMLVMSFGQFVAHDCALGQRIGDSEYMQINTGGEIVNCCEDNGTAVTSDRCLDLPLDHDSFYEPFGKTCSPLVRIQNTARDECADGPAQQYNAVNHFIDLSPVYANTDGEGSRLRSYRCGLLRDQTLCGGIFMPPAEDNGTCFTANENDTECFQTGDNRANQNPVLVAIHTLFLRDHNQIADALCRLNPQWSDEKTFQEARAILIAKYQHITYREFLPTILGKKFCREHNLLPTESGHIDTYDPKCNPGTISSFASSVWRLLHSLIFGKLKMMNNDGEVERVLRLSDWLDRPTIVVAKCEYYQYLVNCLTKQSAQKFDPHHTAEISNYLFRREKEYGEDLISIDIQRNRDYGLPSYNRFRKLCGLRRASKFSDFLDVMKKEDVKNLRKTHKHVDDVDLTTGCLLENPERGSLVGRTARCIIFQQFTKWKDCDRFWFENGGFNHSFTSDQLNEIKKATFARLVCDHGDDIPEAQPNVFSKISKKNPLVQCDSSDIPVVDLSPWKE